MAAHGFVWETHMSQLIGFQANPKLRYAEFLPWVIALLVYFFLPEYLSLGARVWTYILFALSLDLIVGYSGIITLGHSAFFGVGAYVCGILAAKYGISDPLFLLVVSGFAAGLLGLLTGAVILRTKKLTQLMLTLAIAALCLEVANKATSITGGADGLSGVSIAPVLGMFRFDLYGKTAYLWSLSLAFIGWWVIRRVIYSPLGVSMIGIRENSSRMQAVGVNVYARQLKVYTFAALVAGVAGAMLTQTNQFVGLSVLGFEPSGELLVMLILGGVGRIYGAFIGPFIFIIAQDYLAKQFPEYWNFGIGVLLIFVVLYARGGILGLMDQIQSHFAKKH
jgi:branched-chain amino acid transport system permease protein